MRTRSTGLMVVAVLAVALGLSSCTTEATDYSAQTARPLQEQVLAVAEGAAAGQPSVSITRLDELVANLKDARARGTVSEVRYASISAAIALVRGDLETAVAAQKQQEQQQQEQQQQQDEKPGKGHGKKP
jgi:hypothetical protein